jgi:hypothetical protein
LYAAENPRTLHHSAVRVFSFAKLRLVYLDHSSSPPILMVAVMSSAICS